MASDKTHIFSNKHTPVETHARTQQDALSFVSWLWNRWSRSSVMNYLTYAVVRAGRVLAQAWGLEPRSWIPGAPMDADTLLAVYGQHWLADAFAPDAQVKADCYSLLLQQQQRERGQRKN
jgi:hypothetical protein